MKKLGMCITVSMAMIAPQAMAGNWYMVFATFEKPERQVFYVDAWSIEKGGVNASSEKLQLTTSNKPVNTILKELKLLENIVSINAIEVSEKASAPDVVEYTFEFKCKEKQMRIAESQAWYRNGTSERGSLGWAPLAGNWTQRVYEVVCVPGVREDPKKHNILFVGEHGLSTSLADLTWKAFWADGKRPPYTTTKSSAQVKADFDATTVKLNEAIAANKAMQAQVVQGIEERAKVTPEQAWQDESVRRRLQRPNTLRYKKLEGWISRSEVELVRQSGPPTNFYAQGNVRFLTYYTGTQSTTTNGYGAVLDQSVQECNTTFEIIDDKIIDFKVRGNYCP